MKLFSSLVIFALFLSCSARPQTLVDLALDQLLAVYADYSLGELSHFEDRALAETVFQGRVFKKKFEIRGAELSENDGVDHMLESLEVLQMFGHLIHEIKIDYKTLDQSRSKKINAFINKYLSESLVDIELVNCDDVHLTGFTGPFVNAKTVKFSAANLRSKDYKFEQIFPAVSSLDLSEMHYSHQALFLAHFPNLEHWVFEGFLAGFATHVHSLYQRIRLNPQLKEISIKGADWDTVRVISELKELHTLDLNVFMDVSTEERTDIIFDHLKVFKFSFFEKRIIPNFDHHQRALGHFPLVFGSLEEIEFDKPAQRWIDIILRTKSLRKVTTGIIQYEDFMRIVQGLEHLEDIKTETFFERARNIVDVVETGTNLKKVTLVNCNQGWINEAAHILGQSWTLADGNTLIKQ